MNEKFYIISYDLKSPGRDYSSLYSAIKSVGDWLHPIESMWIVWTIQDSNAIFNMLHPKMDVNDLLFISETNLQNRQGWLPKTSWEWMNQRVGNV